MMVIKKHIEDCGTAILCSVCFDRLPTPILPPSIVKVLHMVGR
jgi:hypothetical protein